MREYSVKEAINGGFVVRQEHSWCDNKHLDDKGRFGDLHLAKDFSDLIEVLARLLDSDANVKAGDGQGVSEVGNTTD